MPSAGIAAIGLSSEHGRIFELHQLVICCRIRHREIFVTSAHPNFLGLLACLGEGSYGEVFLALHASLGWELYTYTAPLMV